MPVVMVSETALLDPALLRLDDDGPSFNARGCMDPVFLCERLALGRNVMLRCMSSTCAALVVAGLLGLAVTTISPGPADAAVYCKTAGVPRGCVARHVVVRPVHRTVVYCKTRGVPKGCVMRH
jgi:hypothetical protein